MDVLIKPEGALTNKQTKNKQKSHKREEVDLRTVVRSFSIKIYRSEYILKYLQNNLQ